MVLCSISSCTYILLPEKYSLFITVPHLVPAGAGRVRGLFRLFDLNPGVPKERLNHGSRFFHFRKVLRHAFALVWQIIRHCFTGIFQTSDESPAAIRQLAVFIQLKAITLTPEIGVILSNLAPKQILGFFRRAPVIFSPPNSFSTSSLETYTQPTCPLSQGSWKLSVCMARPLWSRRYRGITTYFQRSPGAWHHPRHGGRGGRQSFPAPDHIYHALIAFRAALIVANGV